MRAGKGADGSGGVGVCEKAPFGSRAEAERVRRLVGDRSRRTLRAYLCRHCHLWHHTTQRKANLHERPRSWYKQQFTV